MIDGLVYDIVILTAVAAVLVWIFASLRQPPLLAYLVVGILLGPLVFNLIEIHEPIEAFGRFGVAFLLFMVGLELNIFELKKVGKVSVLTGMGQIIFTAAIGYGFSTLLGFGVIEALYIAVALTFSSTIIVVKLLSEKNDLQSLYGRISVGFLLVQDFVAVIALMIIGLAPAWTEGIAPLQFAQALGGVFVLFGLVALVAWKILPKLFTSFARHQETLFLGAVAWCFVVAASSEIMGLPFEVGALVAGVSLAPLPFRTEISSRIKSLRDFFMIIFFVILGAGLTFSFSSLPLIAAFSAFILIGNPLIVMIIMGLMGHHRQIGFLSGLTVAQISEFSLIIAALGVSVGHITDNVAVLIASVGVVTIAISTYLITYNHQIYNKIQRFLKIFQKRNVAYKKDVSRADLENHIVLLGFYRMGRLIAESLRKQNVNLVVVDFDPGAIKNLEREGYHYIYGDASDFEILDSLQSQNAKFVISTISEFETNKSILEHLKTAAAKKIIIADSETEAEEFYNLGADYVILPYHLGGLHASHVIASALKDPETLIELKSKATL
jgi:Kef-type K+ transport system membrane component KefB